MKFKGLNDNKITVEANISNGLIGKARKRGSLSQENISKILFVYDDLSADWLLTGRGSMLRDEQPAQAPVQAATPTIIYKSDPKDLKIIALQEDKIRVLEEKLTAHTAGLGFAPAADTPSVGGSQHPRK